jgi:tetratricopeptide (TPR) repeat protein
MAVIASALQALGKFDEARIWLAKRLETVLLVPSGGWRSGVEAGAHQGLGREYLRTGELEKAIEHMEYSVQIRESLVSTIRRGPASAHLPVNLNFLANELNGLGDAYRRAGKFEEAIQTYEKSLHTIVVNRVRSSANLPAYLGMGRVYTGKNDISRAEETLKTYELASKLQVANMVTLSAIELGSSC